MPEHKISPPPTAGINGPISSFNPVFITGFPRSGTTLVAAILDRHSSIAITPETHFFEALNAIRESSSPHYDMSFVERLLNASRICDLSLKAKDVYPLLKKYSFTPKGLFQAVLTAYQQHSGKPLIGEKTPCHIMEADKLLTWYPEAKMIFVLRDGRDVVASLMKMPWRGHNMKRLHAVAWRRYVQLAQKMQRRFPDRFIFVKFNDILSRPEYEVGRLDQFCGVQFEPGQLNASIPTHVVPPWEESWKVRVTRPLDPGRVGRWQSEFTSEEKWALNHTMGRYLKMFGYNSLGLSDCPIHRRFWLTVTGLMLKCGETCRVYRAFAARFGHQ